MVGTESCLKCAGPSFGTESCSIVEAGPSFGTESCLIIEAGPSFGTENCLKVELCLVSDVKGFV